MKSLRSLPLLASLAVWPLFAADQPATPAAPAAPSGPAPAVTPAEFTASGIGMGPTIAADAVVTKVQGGMSFTEGNTTDAKTGDVYFVDQGLRTTDGNRIHKWSAADNKVSLFLEPSGRSNGMYFDAKGNLIACADEKNELWSITPDGKHTVLISSAGYEGKPLDGPNDVWVRPDGGLYVTDPLYNRPWWDPAVTRPSQSIRSVYYLAPDRKELKRVAGVEEKFSAPNGIIGTPDGKTLYVADLSGGKTYGYDIQPDGSLTNRRLIANYGSDGMTLDDQGNLYFSTGLRGGGRGGRGGAPGAGGPGGGGFGPGGFGAGGQPPAGFGPGGAAPGAGGAAAAGGSGAPAPGGPAVAAAPGAGAPPAGGPAGGAPGAGGPPPGFGGGGGARGGARGGFGGGPGGSGVAIVDTKTGKLVGFITVPEQPANMAFGGKNHDILVISARTSLYSIQTKVKGANPAK